MNCCLNCKYARRACNVAFLLELDKEENHNDNND